MLRDRMGGIVLIYATIPAMTSLFTDLRRRNVFRVAIAYLVLSWLVLQVGEILAPALRLPEWVDSLLAFFLILGFSLASLNELNIDWAYQRALAYAVRGEKDKAFEWFDTAIEIRDRGLNLAVGDPTLDNLRDYPRFAGMLKRMNRTAIR